MSKLASRYLCWTFGIMVVCWGSCVALGFMGYQVGTVWWMFLPYLLGGWSPTIGAYLAQRGGANPKKLTDWMKDVFSVRQKSAWYGLSLAVALLHVLPLALLGGYDSGAPLISLVFMAPMMLLGGGLEEPGWRGILQPELEKRYGFDTATALTALVWWLWHLPLFFIPGVGQYGNDFLIFGLNVLGLSYALAALRRVTGSVWLCVVSHCLINALSGVFLVRESLSASMVAAGLLILGSVFVISREDRRKEESGSGSAY
jgi:membrane protease YdiL (CAAX protease family)